MPGSGSGNIETLKDARPYIRMIAAFAWKLRRGCEDDEAYKVADRFISNLERDVKEAEQARK